MTLSIVLSSFSKKEELKLSTESKIENNFLKDINNWFNNLIGK